MIIIVLMIMIMIINKHKTGFGSKFYFPGPTLSQEPMVRVDKYFRV